MRTLETGHGYWFRIAGDQPVDWTRAATPARRLLRREAGLRLIAWPGPDETAPSAAAETIVGARADAICWDPVAQQFLRWTSESDESGPERVLNRGDALYVRLSHRMAWLEASTAVPRMAFDGGLHGDLPLNFRAGVEADVRYTVRRFATRFEHRLEPERLTIRVVTNDAALRKLQHGAEIGADSWTSGPIEGGFSSIIVRSQVWAADDGRRYGIVAPTVSVHARTILLGQYFHAVQRDLAGPRYSGIPGWFVQGGPFWMLAEAGLPIRSLERDEDDASQFVIADRAEPGLADRALGVTATRRLVERFGRDSYFDFWRNAANAAAEATWRDVFHTTFGITVETFHDQFEQWIRASHPFAHGRIIVPEGIAAKDLVVTAERLAGLPRRADVSPDGSFRVAIRTDDGYRLGVALAGSDCHAVASVDGVLTNNRLAQFFSHADLPASPIEIEVPADFCQRHLRGQIRASSAEVIADLRISACLNFDLCSSTVTGADGSFDIPVPLPGRYTITIADRTNSCAVFAHGGATVGIPIIATSHEVIAGDVGGVEVQLADNWCARRIQGRLTNLPQGRTSGIMIGVTANPLMLVACRVSRSPCTEAEPAADGSFLIQIPAVGYYVLSLKPRYAPTNRPLGECGLEFPALLHVSLFALGGITWEVPPDFCRRRVEGTLTTPDGKPFRQFAVSACTVRQSGFGRLCGANSITDAEGRLSIYVPYHGPFFLAPSATRECPNAEDAAHRHELTMEDAYLVGVDWRLPPSACASEYAHGRGP